MGTTITRKAWHSRETETLDLSTTPKDYQPLVKAAFKAGRDVETGGCGYATDGHAEAACDSYRLHYEHSPVRDVWQRVAPDTPDARPWTVDRHLVAWLKVAKKWGPNPVVKVRDGYLQVDDAEYGTARFARPMPVPAEWSDQYGVAADFLLEAVEYLTRGKHSKPVTLTVAAPVCPLVIHNCTRHAVIMPARVND